MRQTKKLAAILFSNDAVFMFPASTDSGLARNSLNVSKLKETKHKQPPVAKISLLSICHSTIVSLARSALTKQTRVEQLSSKIYNKSPEISQQQSLRAQSYNFKVQWQHWQLLQTI